MPFDKSFQRGADAGPPPPALGSDADPSPLRGTAAAAYASNDNCFTFQLKEAGPQPVQLAVAAVFNGTEQPGIVTVAIYLWDPDQTQTWLALPTPATVSLGQVVLVDVPVVMSALSLGWTIALVPSVASPTPGIYTFMCGLSESTRGGDGGGGGGGGPEPDVVATATLGAEGDVLGPVSTTGRGAVAVQFAAGLDGVISFEASADGVNWQPLVMSDSDGTGSASSVEAGDSAALFQASCGAYDQVRAVVTAYTSGSCTATIRASQADATGPLQIAGTNTLPVEIEGPLPLPVTIMGGGGGDATASNQVLQINQAIATSNNTATTANTVAAPGSSASTAGAVQGVAGGVPVATVQALVFQRSDATGTVVAGSPAVPAQATSRVYSAGVTFVNTDPSVPCRIGQAGINGSMPKPGYTLAANGGAITYGPIDIATVYVYSTGSPAVDWLGVDLTP
jgi:hypothetical protein